MCIKESMTRRRWNHLLKRAEKMPNPISLSLCVCGECWIKYGTTENQAKTNVYIRIDGIVWVVIGMHFQAILHLLMKISCIESKALTKP